MPNLAEPNQTYNIHRFHSTSLHCTAGVVCGSVE